MQDYLIQRYLGNKAAVADDIASVMNSLAKPGDLVFDAFSGSLAVSAMLRGAGFRIACNDINHFSWIFARAYFSSSELPWPSTLASRRGRQKAAAWSKIIQELTEPYARSMPGKARRTDIFDHYCEKGNKSAFKSGRGTSGRRRFFSPKNAILIDRALSRIRHWHLTGLLDEQTRCILTASVLSAVEKVSNTQGTYHDFPRAFIDARALKPLQLRVPEERLFEGLASKLIGKAQDTLAFAPTLPPHKIMYLDPPYNFRQYTSYYFMLNLISEYPEVDDLDHFFAGIEFVRGQNMASDFKSSFCSKDEFIPSLKALVQAAKADYVVLSYFDGRNHWGEFKSDKAETKGRRILGEMFESDLFVKGSFQFIPVKRLNYQSYGGHAAKQVEEFLFIAQKSKFSRFKTIAEPTDEMGKLQPKRPNSLVA